MTTLCLYRKQNLQVTHRFIPKLSTEPNQRWLSLRLNSFHYRYGCRNFHSILFLILWVSRAERVRLAVHARDATTKNLIRWPQKNVRSLMITKMITDDIPLS